MYQIIKCMYALSAKYRKCILCNLIYVKKMSPLHRIGIWGYMYDTWTVEEG